MKTVLKTLIDYSLFEKYGKEYFLNNRILPLYENEMSIKFGVCKSSKLENIKNDFTKLISFIEIDELEILFILAHLDEKISLYLLASKSIFQNSFEKYIDKFLDELLYVRELKKSMLRLLVIFCILSTILWALFAF